MRAQLTRLGLLLGIAACLLLVGGSERLEWIVPGQLHATHSAVVDGCESCHQAAKSSPVNWVGFLTLDSRPAQSEACLGCHDLGRNPYREHSLSRGRLHALGEYHRKRAPKTVELVQLSAAPALREDASAPEEPTLQCATCHREHKGRQADLRAMTDAQCQGCHQRVFDGFDTASADAHPPFESFPHSRRTHLVFDHQRHERKHFTQKDQTFECLDCHYSDSAGRDMLLARFEDACEGCHENWVRAEDFKPFTIAEIDTDALRELLPDASGWMSYASEVTSPFWYVLLVALDPENAAMVRLVRELGDLSVLDPEDLTRAEAEAVRDYVVATKTALTALGGGLSEDAFAASMRDVARRLNLTRHLSSELALSAIDQWRSVDAESRGLEGSGASPVVAGVASEPPSGFAVREGWAFDDESQLVYRTELHADPLRAAWVELTQAVHARGLIDDALLDEALKSSDSLACRQCHTSNPALTQSGAVKNASGTGFVHWSPRSEPVQGDAFTRYRHEPHASLGDQRGCEVCHRLSDSDAYRSSFATGAGVDYVSNFLPMTVETCSQCHNERAASDSCLTCHDYHNRGRAQAHADDSSSNSSAALRTLVELTPASR
jgi:hypothetical protein